MTPAELNRLDELLHKTSMYKLRKMANDIHKECKRSVLVVMVMELEFPDTPQENRPARRYQQTPQEFPDRLGGTYHQDSSEKATALKEQRFGRMVRKLMEKGPDRVLGQDPGEAPGESKELTLEQRFSKNEKWLALKRSWDIREKEHTYSFTPSDGQFEFDFEWGSPPIHWSSYSGPGPEDPSGEEWVNQCFHKALFEIGEELGCDPTFLVKEGSGTILLTPNSVEAD